MKNLSFEEAPSDGDYTARIDPDTGRPVCCAGYELIPEPCGTVWRCSAGGHVYKMESGDVVLDTWGRPMFKKRGDDEEIARKERL